MSSHRSRTAETRAMPPNSANVSIPRITKPSRPTADNYTTRLPQRASITSVGSSSGRRSSGSMDSSTKSLQIRPSALPRSTSASSQTKLAAIASSRPTPPASIKSSSNETSRPSEISKAVSALSGHRTVSSREPSFDFAFETQSSLSIEGNTAPEMDVSQKRRSRSGFTLPVPAGPLPPRLIPELQALAAVSNRTIPPPPSSSLGSIMSSPSTVFTTSPSPWSASTTTTTPVSWSSASPGIVQPANVQPASKRSQTVPVPAPGRTKLPKLPVLKENQPPSTGSSKADLKEESKSLRKKLKKTPLNSPAPTPPPRSSSARSRSNSKSSVQSKNEPDNPPPVPTNTEESPLAKHSGSRVERIGQDLDAKQMIQGHSRLQEAINSPPSRPSRDGMESVGLRTNAAVNTNMLHNGTRKLLDAAPVGQITHRRFASRDDVKRKVEPDKDTQKQSARSRLAKFSKIALFGRSRETSNTEASSVKQQPPPAPPRKGPVAGTGHEGYGRFGRKTRKGSIGSNATTTEPDASQANISQRHQRKDSGKSSRRTSSSQSELDDFASSRMKPVVLKGGSQKTLPSAVAGLHPPAKSSDVSVDSYVSSNPPLSAPRKVSEENHSAPKSHFEQGPTLAQRRSQKFADANEAFRLPDPIETKNLPAPPCIDSQNTSYSSDVPTSAAYGDFGAEGHRGDPYLAERQRKKSRKLKWNIFTKRDEISDPIPITKPKDQAALESEVPVSISTVAVTKPMPYYAMLGSDSEIMTTETIGQYLNEAAQSPKFQEDLELEYSQEELSPVKHRAESILLPSAPERKFYTEDAARSLENIQPPFAAKLENSPHDSDFDFPLPPQTRNSPPRSEQTPTPPEQPKPRQPRLAQVGRIPKVVPRSQQADAPRQQPVSVPVQPFKLDLRNESVGSSSAREEPRRRLLPKLATESLRNPVLSTVPEAEGDATPRANPTEQNLTMLASNEDFLRFSDPHNSDFTTSSSSDGIITIMGPSFPATAPIRQPRTYHHDHEDDVWNEYDEFIDRVMSPSGLRYDNSQMLAAPIANGAYSSTKLNSKNKGLAIIPPLLAPQGPSQPLPTPPYAYSTSPPLQQMSSSEEMRLRRSRIAAALHSSYASFDPSSPFSMREFIAEYGRRDSAKMSERQSSSTAGMKSPMTPVFAEQPADADAKHYENASHIDDIERTRNPLKHSELSYASLMVSRALSFGRVLFSPAHAEIETQPERHVLVIDGLGNEDWSIYCAVTYQSEKAFVHDLKEKRPTRRGSQASRKSDSIPSNHRRAEVPNFNDRFPFPPSFFSVIVLRFPPVMAESKLRNIMSECKRVLAPGGYLELMVLELDIVNMGVLTRRAVKDLKIKMATSDRDVSLKPIIDNVQTVLGSRGFSNVNQCVVGVPVVGRPVSSTGSTSSSRSSGSPIKRSSAGPRPFESLSLQEGFSLNDLVADHSENADAKISRMVSRTARSWWQHCFEASVISDGNLAKSVFANKEIMTECKTRASNFKLLIAYTQKSGGEQRRRTLSEPIVPTLATAGISKQQKSMK